MLLAQLKEREYRFRLALRIALPIFTLTFAFISHTFITTYQTLSTTFVVESLALLVFSTYYIFYLIYNGFSIKITDDVTQTFTREYLYNYIKKEIDTKKQYTLVLISIDNLNDINMVYGIKNGDKVLQTTVKWVSDFLESQNISNFPMGHIKGGDFIIGLENTDQRYNTIVELMLLKTDNFKVDNIEVKISANITDTSYSNQLDYMVEHLFELQDVKTKNIDNLNPNELEVAVINAVRNKQIFFAIQDVFGAKDAVFSECFVKLKTADGKIIYPKKYIKIINKLGFSIEFDLMVIEYMINNISDNKKYAINISATSLRNDKFLQKLKEFLNDGVNIKFIFIISEIEYFSYTDKFNDIIRSLKKYNIEIAVDRLGSLHSSFLYLRELDVDYMIFDRYYSNYAKIEKNIDILKGFNLMLHNRGIKSWMKNIEDKKSYDTIKTIGIDFIQGKYLSSLKEQN